MAKKEPQLFVRTLGEVAAGECQQRAAPAAGASYTLVGGIILLGGIGYAVDHWQGTAPWGLFVGLMLGFDRRVLRAGEDRLAAMKAGRRGWSEPASCPGSSSTA